MSRYTPEGRARISAAVAESNRRRGEPDLRLRKARRRFRQHKANAEARGVPFLLTFEEWWHVWDTSGKWERRGTHAGQYCMSRHGDTGAYEVGNVFVNLFAVNTSDGVAGIKRTPEQNAARSRWMRGNRNGVGRRWMNNGTNVRCVPAREVEQLSGIGWNFGRIV